MIYEELSEKIQFSFSTPCVYMSVKHFPPYDPILCVYLKENCSDIEHEISYAFNELKRKATENGLEKKFKQLSYVEQLKLANARVIGFSRSDFLYDNDVRRIITKLGYDTPLQFLLNAESKRIENEMPANSSDVGDPSTDHEVLYSWCSPNNVLFKIMSVSYHMTLYADVTHVLESALQRGKTVHAGSLAELVVSDLKYFLDDQEHVLNGFKTMTNRLTEIQKNRLAFAGISVWNRVDSRFPRFDTLSSTLNFDVEDEIRNIGWSNPFSCEPYMNAFLTPSSSFERKQPGIVQQNTNSYLKILRDSNEKFGASIKDKPMALIMMFAFLVTTTLWIAAIDMTPVFFAVMMAIIATKMVKSYPAHNKIEPAKKDSVKDSVKGAIEKRREVLAARFTDEPDIDPIRFNQSKIVDGYPVSLRAKVSEILSQTDYLWNESVNVQTVPEKLTELSEVYSALSSENKEKTLPDLEWMIGQIETIVSTAEETKQNVAVNDFKTQLQYYRNNIALESDLDLGEDDDPPNTLLPSPR